MAAAAAVYGWWATGVPPFTVRAYLAVGVPAGLLLAVGIMDSLSGSRGAPCPTREPTRDPTRGHAHGPDQGPAPEPGPAPGRDRLQLRRTFPWVVLVLVAVGLEATGLALGGRSEAVPTLSTVVDHALAWHVVRFVLFCGWIAVGWSPSVRAAARAFPIRDGTA